MKTIKITINVTDARVISVRAVLEALLTVSEGVRGYGVATWDDESADLLADRARRDRERAQERWQRAEAAHDADKAALRDEAMDRYDEAMDRYVDTHRAP